MKLYIGPTIKLTMVVVKETIVGSADNKGMIMTDVGKLIASRK